MTSVLPHARALSQQHGLSVLPVGSDKRPSIKWAAFQKRRMTTAEVEENFATADRLGLICGPVSDNLEVIDFDIDGFFDRWVDLLAANGHDDLLNRVVVEQTPSGGRHVLYRCPEMGRNQKLAMVYGESGRPEVAIETRGDGGYVVAFPSPGYTMVRGKLSGIPTLTREERDALLYAARILDEVADEPPVPQRADTSAAGRRPGDDYNARATWHDVLTPYGWRHVGQTGGRDLWCRPGKEGRHTSATTGNGYGKDLMKVHTSNGHPLKVDGVYSKFGALAELGFGGDYSLAASDLNRQGYGERPKTANAEPSAAGTVGEERAEPSEAGAAEVESTGFLSHRLRWSQIRELPPKRMLVDKILGVGDSAMIVGLRKGGKTAVVFDLILSMLGGGTFAGKFEVARPLTVAYFTTEGTGAIHVRMATANIGHRVDDETLEEQWVYVPKLPQTFDDASEYSVLKVAQEIKDACIPLDVMVIDTFAKSIIGAEENSNSDMSRALSTLHKAREILGCATILLHHTNKAGGLRGASAIDGDLDVLLQVEWDEETGDRRLCFGFAKDLGPFDAVPFELEVMDTETPGAIRVNWTPGRRNFGMPAIDRILAVMRQDPESIWALGQFTGILTDLRANTIQTALSRETDRADARVSIIKVADKPLRYRLTQAGKW